MAMTAPAVLSPPLPYALPHLRLDLDDLLCQFDPGYQSPPPASPPPATHARSLRDPEDARGCPSGLPAASRLRRILHAADPEAEGPAAFALLPTGLEGPNALSLDPSCLYGAGTPSRAAPPFSLDASLNTPSSHGLSPTSPDAGTPTRTYVVPAPAIHVSELRRFQQQQQQQGRSPMVHTAAAATVTAMSPPKYKGNGSGNGRRSPKAPAGTPALTPAPPPPPPYACPPQMAPPAPGLAQLPIILFDPVTGQPVGAVAPQQPGASPVPGQHAVIGLVPQPHGPPIPMTFVPVPIPSDAVSAMCPALPAHALFDAHSWGQPPSFNPPAPFVGPPDGTAPSAGPVGPSALTHPSMPPYGPQFPPPPPPAPVVVRREKVILKIIHPESGEEVSPVATARIIAPVPAEPVVA